MKKSGPDSLQSWLVACTCSFICVICYGMARMSGMLFVASVERYNADRRKASFPFVLCDVLQTSVGPLAGYIAQKVGLRGVIISGSVLTSLGVGGCFFAQNIETVTVLWGVIYGAGFGFSVLLLPVVLNQYFHKYRATAIGLSNMGGTMGYFILPQIFEHLMEKYGLSGTFLIFGGMAMNCIPAAMVLREPQCTISSVKLDKSSSLSKENPSKLEAYSERKIPKSFQTSAIETRRKEPSILHRTDKIEIISTGVSNPSFLRDSTLVSEAFNCESVVLKEFKNESIKHQKKFSTENVTTSDIIKEEILSPTIFHSLSLDELNDRKNENLKVPDLNLSSSQVQHANHEFSDIISDRVQESGHFECGKKQCQRNYITSRNSDLKTEAVAEIHTETPKSPQGFAFKICFDPIFILISIANAVLCFGLIALITVIVDFSRDIGVDRDHEKYIIMSISISGSIGLIGFGWITDGGYLSSTNFAALAFLTSCTMTTILPWVTSLTVLLIVVSVWSLVQSVVVFLIPVIVGEYFASNLQTIAMSSCYFLTGPLYLTISPLVGFFRDGMGSYDYMFFLLSTVSFLSSLVILSLPCLRKDQSKECNDRLPIPNSQNNTC